MRQKLIPLFVGAAISFAGTEALAQDTGWYVGGGIGLSKLKEDLDGPAREVEAVISDLGVDLGLSGATSSNGDEEDTAYKVYFGYRVNPNFAVEGGYIDLGEFTGSASGSGTDGLDNYAIDVDGSVESTGFFLSLLGIAPVTESIDLFGKVGMYYYDTDADLNITTLQNGIVIDSYKISGGNTDQEVIWGLGAKYNLDKWAIRAEYERFERLEAEEDLDLQSDVDVWSLGIEYSF